MITEARNLVGALTIGTAMMLTPVTMTSVSAAAEAVVDAQQAGLVNVDVGDVLSRNNIAVAAAVNAIAQVCPSLNVDQIGVLANQALASGTTQTTTCDATGQAVSIAPATVGGGQGQGQGPGQGQGQQGGLVNVQVGDVLSRNNIAVAAAVNAIAQVCPGLSVDQIGVLANQALASGTTQTTTCDATGQAISIAPATVGGGRR